MAHGIGAYLVEKEREGMGVLPGEKLQRRMTVGVTALLIVGICMMFALAWKNEAGQPDLPTEPQRTAAPERQGPLSGMTIVVDPGHGGYDGGARCRDSGVWEKELNLAVAQATEKALARCGANVVMTRSRDEDLCTDDRPEGKTMKRQDMERRVEIAASNSTDMVLSIHMNEYRDRREAGPQVFYRAGSDCGRLLAGCMQEALIRGTAPSKERTAMSGDYFILQLEAPSVLIECGFISNPTEEAKLLTADYQEQLAEAICDGVQQYLTMSRRLSGETQ